MSLFSKGFRVLAARSGKNAKPAFSKPTHSKTTGSLVPDDVVVVGFATVSSSSSNSSSYATGSSSSTVSRTCFPSPRRPFFSGSPSMNEHSAQRDRVLVDFLATEIKLEKQQQVLPVLPRVKGFRTEAKTDGEVVLTRDPGVDDDNGGEVVTVKFFVAAPEQRVEEGFPTDEIGGNEDLKYELWSRPDFRVDLTRGGASTTGQTLTFRCRFVPGSSAAWAAEAADRGEAETVTEDAADTFAIDNFYVHDGDGHASPTQYRSDGYVIGDDLYSLLMKMLRDRGIGDEFVRELADLSKAHENKLYIKTLEDIKMLLSS